MSHDDFVKGGISSLPARGAWVEIPSVASIVAVVSESLPARGAWVEIIRIDNIIMNFPVAPRTGSVG